jgi:hypothetical protein
MKHGVLIFIVLYNMVVDRVHKGNELKSANQSFNQVLLLYGNILDALVDSYTLCFGYR